MFIAFCGVGVALSLALETAFTVWSSTVLASETSLSICLLTGVSLVKFNLVFTWLVPVKGETLVVLNFFHKIKTVNKDITS